MKKLSISLLQTNLQWQQRQSNLENFAEMIDQQDSDLFILPEVFTTGFSNDAINHAETMDGTTMQWLADTSSQNQCAITGSLIINEDGNYFNRMIFMRPNGEFDYYDKRHLFRMANEHKRYTLGNSRLVIEYCGWRICPMICYDLRFPVWCRNQHDYDLMIFVANWPEARKDHWRQLLLARAIENQAYVAGVNRIGSDQKQLTYAGDSLLIDPRGKVLLDAKDQDGSFSHIIEGSVLEEYRQLFPTHLDADVFSIEGVL